MAIRPEIRKLAADTLYLEEEEEVREAAQTLLSHVPTINDQEELYFIREVLGLCSLDDEPEWREPLSRPVEHAVLERHKYLIKTGVLEPPDLTSLR